MLKFVRDHSKMEKQTDLISKLLTTGSFDFRSVAKLSKGQGSGSVWANHPLPCPGPLKLSHSLFSFGVFGYGKEALFGRGCSASFA